MAAEVERESRVGRMRPLGRRLVLFPMPLQGHINPMFQLATLLFNRGFSITVVHTRFNAPDPASYPSFRFVPIDEHPGKPHSADDLIALAIYLNDGCRQRFRDRMAALLEEARKEGEEPVACVVADALLYGTKSVAEELGVQRVVMRTGSAASLRLFRVLPALWEKGYFPIHGMYLSRHSRYLSSL